MTLRNLKTRRKGIARTPILVLVGVLSVAVLSGIIYAVVTINTNPDDAVVVNENAEFSVISISPSSGSTSGGEVVTINEENFPYASTDEYIGAGVNEDGSLIAHFDGVDNVGLGDRQHSSDTNTWMDLKQSIMLPRTSAPTNSAWEANGWRIGDDGVSFNRNGSLTAYNFPSGGAARTVETVFGRPNNNSYTNTTFVSGYGMTGNNNQSFNFTFFTDQFGVEAWGGFPTGIATNISNYTDILKGNSNIVSSQVTYAGSGTGAFTLSLNGNPATVNAGGANKNINTIANNANTYLSIGSRKGADPLKGYKILSYRVYNRVLTQDELAHNANLDQKRFLAPPVVTIGDETCTDVVVLSTTQLQCTAPAYAEGSVAVSVKSGDKTDTSLTYTYVGTDVMTVIKVEPNVGPSFGGTWIKVSGNNLDVDSITVAEKPCAIKETDPDGSFVKCEIPAVSIDENEFVDVIVTFGEKTYKLEKSFEYVKVSKTPISGNVE
jgi:hypothetical protein